MGVSSLVLVAGLLLTTPASADVVYDNGYNGQRDAWTINYGYEVANSFYLAAPNTLNGVNVLVWLTAGNAAQTVDWGISSSSDFGGALGGGTANLTEVTTDTGWGTYPILNGYSYILHEYTFDVPNVALAAGTYWLTLKNATGTNPDSIYWDMSFGPSACVQSANGACEQFSDGWPGTHSNAFQILGSDGGSAVPEPASLSLFGGGLLALAALARRVRS